MRCKIYLNTETILDLINICEVSDPTAFGLYLNRK